MNIHFHGPLRRNLVNPRYFTDDSGKAIYLTGSHTWANWIEIKQPHEPDFPFGEWLDFMQGHHHNFMRLWSWDHPENAPWTDDRVIFYPMAHARTGPGTANDGLPKFDLTQFNDEYFERLRTRVIAAGERGIYASVMLFEGWCVKWSVPTSDAWATHPYNAANNINGVNGDTNGDGKADVYALESPDVLRFQEAYVRKVVDTVNDLDNVLWEIINEVENTERGFQWQEHMIGFLRDYERTKPKQHPIGMTAEGGSQYNPTLFASIADWISPGNGPSQEYRYDPPAADGSKVILTDTDHLWGHGVNYRWVWKSFMRGLNPLFMDPWWPVPGSTRKGYAPNLLNVRDYPTYGPARIAMGQTRCLAERVDLNHMTPRPDFASSRYCLANPGAEMLVYMPDDDRASVYLGIEPITYSSEWFDTCTGETVAGDPVTGGGLRQMISPLGIESVLYLRAQ